MSEDALNWLEASRNKPYAASQRLSQLMYAAIAGKSLFPDLAPAMDLNIRSAYSPPKPYKRARASIFAGRDVVTALARHLWLACGGLWSHMASIPGTLVPWSPCLGHLLCQHSARHGCFDRE